MGIQRVSFNVNGSNWPERNYSATFLEKFAPTTILVMDSYKDAIDLEARLPHTKICHRSYSDVEHVTWNYESPESYCAREMAWGHPGIWRNVLNEPGVEDPRMIWWLVEVANEFSRHGFKAVLGNFSVGGYEKRHIESGYFDPLLRVIQDSEHYLGIHEYTSILLPFGASLWSVDQLYDKTQVQPNVWPKRSDLQVTRQVETSSLPNRWHFLRSSWFTIRAHELGLQTPQFWVTEWGLDALPDLGAQGVLDHFAQQYGVPPPHASIRGVNTLRRVYADYFPQWTFEQAVFEQYKWLESIYPDNYVGFNIFTLNGNDDWKRDAGTDYSELIEFHMLLLEAKDTPMPPTDPPIPPVPPVEPTMPADDSPLWLQATLTPITGVVNIRSQPKKGDNVINTLDRARIGWIARDAGVQQSDGVWYPISLTEGDGWARGDVFTFTLITTPPPVDPIPDPEYFVKVTPEQRAALIALLEQIA